MSQSLLTELQGKLQDAVAGKDILLSIWDPTGSELLAVAGQQGLLLTVIKDTIELLPKMRMVAGNSF